MRALFDVLLNCKFLEGPCLRRSLSRSSRPRTRAHSASAPALAPWRGVRPHVAPVVPRCVAFLRAVPPPFCSAGRHLPPWVAQISPRCSGEPFAPGRLAAPDRSLESCAHRGLVHAPASASAHAGAALRPQFARFAPCCVPCPVRAMFNSIKHGHHLLSPHFVRGFVSVRFTSAAASAVGQSGSHA